MAKHLQALVVAVVGAMTLGSCVMDQQPEHESDVEQFSHLPGPSNVTATPTAPTRITVSWSAVTSATKYYVYERVTAGGSEYYAGTTLAPGTSLQRANRTAGTEYCYRVRAAVGSEPPGAFSTLTCATTPVAGTAPLAPSGVVATAVAADRINVTWNAVSNATRYFVYQSITDPNGTYTYVGTALAPSTSLSIANLQTDTRYCYKVAASNANGTSTLSEPAACDHTFVSGLEGFWKLNEGSGTLANDVSGRGRHGTLVGAASWSNNRAPLDNNRYAVATSGGAGDAVNVPDVNVWWFTGPFTVALWTKVSSTGTTRIAGKRAAGCGAVDWELGQDAGGLYFRGASTLSFGTSLAIETWSHVAVTYDGTTATLYVDGAQVGAGSFTAGPRSADPMQFGNSGGCGGGGVSVDWIQIHSRPLSSAEIATIGERPPAPTNFTATVAGATRVNLAWDSVANASKYALFKGTMSGDQAFFTSILAPTTMFSDGTNQPSTQTSWYVVSVRDGLVSLPSAEQVVTTDPPIAAPTSVTATPLTSSRIRVDWVEVTGAVKYYIYESVAGGAFAFKNTVLAGTATFTAANLTANTMYSYYVVAQGPDSRSAPSNTASATTFP